MANYIGFARTNYVRIRDVEGLKADLRPFLEDGQLRIAEEEDGRIAILDKMGHGWPVLSEYDESPEGVQFDPREQVCPHLEEGEVLVMMEAGREADRYAYGHAVAYSWEGEFVTVNLDDIYQRASAAFGVGVDEISRAAY